MKIQITSKQSIYLEVADKIESFIKLGIYKEDERLPSCRKLALDLKVNPNTIERAYSLLEERGIVYVIPKKGIYVKGTHDSNIVNEEVLKTIKHFKEINVTKEDLINIIEEIYQGEN